MSSTNVSPLATTQDAAHLNSLPPPGKLNNEELLVFLRSRAYLSSPLYGSDFSRLRKS